MTVNINKNALNSLFTSPQAKKVMEKQLIEKLSNIKCPVHHTTCKDIKITGTNPKHLKITAKPCCETMKVKLEDFIKSK
ncbi:hypothetical protein [Cyanobacterium aponinum]|uniref:hypothetical protein n=1 Tax=Cyanobacterium aponinum TaxID=379064 RepID=UPI000C12DF32|nr:hypothetical protein [Cyanobacterium aponinum]PHV63761.1 hypothetical protein CSQ80_04105 [Cyanobacterium aponinum IPPAS B-1201]